MLNSLNWVKYESYILVYLYIYYFDSIISIIYQALFIPNQILFDLMKKKCLFVNND